MRFALRRMSRREPSPIWSLRLTCEKYPFRRGDLVSRLR